MNKPRRVRIYKLSTFDTFTEKERNLHELYKEASKNKVFAKQQRDEEIHNYKGIRKIDRSKLYLYQTDKKTGETIEYENSNKQIALFESEMVRYATDFNSEDKCPLVMEIVYMKVAEQTEILKQIIDQGLMIGDDKYVFYSSTTNQMKNGEFILIKESFANEHNLQFMCGLTDEIINEKGGCNSGKYLAYKGLPLSSSFIPDGYKIEIDKCLVVPDFETKVTDVVDYIKHDGQKITGIERCKKDITVPHTDGAGIFLPGVLPASAQIRCGHLKGAVFPFDFKKFLTLDSVEGKKPSPVIKDAWGKEHDVLKEDIQVIFTASQLKMWKYYDSWDDYKQAFKDNKMQIAINKFADTDPKGFVKSSYQFLQTLSSEKLDDEMIEKLCADTIAYLDSIKTDVDKVIEIMGDDYITDTMREYRPLLQDSYVQGRVESKFCHERTDARGGKLILKDSLYSYICPDLYAFCEWLFCGIEKPAGIIPKNYLYNSFFNDKDYTKVDCLRSPHLYIEHGIRNLVKDDVLEKCKEWFNDLDTIVSNHDLLCRILQFDVDGDECLLTPNEHIIACVPDGVVPLYYEAFDAQKEEVCGKVLYRALVSSLENSNIGDISNIMTKNYNNEDSEAEFSKIMCCYNNFTIDFPKTQKNIELDQYQHKYDELKKEKPPYFFHYAKGKKKSNCKEISYSNVDRICQHIHKKTGNRRYSWKNEEEKFNPSMLLNHKIKVNDDVKYSELEKIMYELKRKETLLNQVIDEVIEKTADANADDFKRNKLEIFYHMCEKIILWSFDTREEAAEYLLEYEYFNRINESKGKTILWNCFGDVIYENVCNNLQLEEVPIRRYKYHVDSEKTKTIGEKIVDELVAVKNEPVKAVSIYKEELDWIENQNYRSNSMKDRELLYILLILNKIYDGKIKLSNKKKMITCNKIDKWIGESVGSDVTITDKGLSRLEKKGLISIKKKKSEREITVKVPKLTVKDKAFDVISVFKQNPLIPFYEDNKEHSVAECKICGKKFIKHRKQITCSDRCSKENELRRKRKKTE